MGKRKSETEETNEKEKRSKTAEPVSSEDDATDEEVAKGYDQDIDLSKKTLKEIDAEDVLSEDEDQVSNGSAKKVSESEDTLQMDFVFCDFDDNDFHMLKMMLQRNSNPYFLDPSIESHMSSLVDTIVSYKATGTVIRVNDVKNEEDEISEVCAFISLIHLSRFNKTKDWSKSLLKKVKSKFEGLNVDTTGVIISERLMNVPDSMGDALHKNLVKDLEWAQENAEDLGLAKDAFNFSHILLLSRCVLVEGDQIHTKPEEERLLKSAENNIIFHTRGENVVKAGMITIENYLNAVKNL